MAVNGNLKVEEWLPTNDARYGFSLYMHLSWLPVRSDWNSLLQQARQQPAAEAVPALARLASYDIDFIETAKLDRALMRFASEVPAYLDRTRPIRLALLGSSTVTHLVPGIRVAALRRGFWVEIFEGTYGLYWQELADSGSELHKFAPDVILLGLDAHHVVSGPDTALQALTTCWREAKQMGAAVIQQTVLPVFHPLLGNNEHHHEASNYSVVQRINRELRAMAAAEGVHLLAVDSISQIQGLAAWYEPALWHRSKQEVHPRVSNLYGDHVGRLLAAIRGLSYKCLALDLDNTIWGGVIGDDGVEGILLGQGHAVGESYVSFQKYVKALAERGVILAVCSKNELQHARSPFERHPEMVLTHQDIACFVANWEDKAGNLRAIARTLNIGLDAIVFVDDNPFERNLVRQELPMVAVPELPEDPALYEVVLAEAGYFETLGLTAEDRKRGKLYAQNSQRERLKEEAADLPGYLRSLNMELSWAPFDPVGLARITQLVNKSNQFNLTTRRYTQEELAALMSDPHILTLQLRLTDAFGDNGMIAVVIGRLCDAATLEIDTWLMSCRVLGRQVEEATLNLLVERAKDSGVRTLVGRYLPTAKNALVQEHYRRLGFELRSRSDDGSSTWTLEVDTYKPKATFARLVEAELASTGKH